MSAKIAQCIYEICVMYNVFLYLYVLEGMFKCFAFLKYYYENRARLRFFSTLTIFYSNIRFPPTTRNEKTLKR